MAMKKKYYVPGMISLIGLPILGFLFIPKPPPHLKAIRIFIPYDSKSNDPALIRFSKQTVYQAISKKKVVQLDLSEDEYGRGLLLKRKFEFILRELDRMNFTSDTTTVLKVNIDDNNTYGDVIWLVNQTLVYDIRRWAIVDNSFYFINGRPPMNYHEIHPSTYHTLKLKKHVLSTQIFFCLIFNYKDYKLLIYLHRIASFRT
jgi:hypothetical protein